MGKLNEHRFNVMNPVRGLCDNCVQRGWCIVVAIKRPFKKDIRICHNCLLKDALRIKEMLGIREAARERIKAFKKKEEERKKRKDSTAGFAALASMERRLRTG